MRIHFHGGADTVTGSQHILECGGSLVLRDCGMFQGRREESDRINRNLPFRPASLAAMELSHAHIDHCGNIPTLCARGYEGPIWTTHPTADLVPIMLRDSARIQEQDAAYLNQKTSRKGLQPVEPLYTINDAEKAVRQLRPQPLHKPLDIAPGIKVTTYEAGHILGSALSHYVLRDNGREARVGFAVDLGRRNLPLIRDPEMMPPVDLLVSESTYGDRLHSPAGDASQQLRDIITKTYARGGKVFIPAFALERAQEIVFHVSALIHEGKLPRHDVYVDSPMAAAVTKVFDENDAVFDTEYKKLRHEMGCLMCPEWVKFVSTGEESKAVTARPGPHIVIAASGMCEHGRILHHLKAGIGSEKNSIVIVGFQAEYTLGRRLLEGETQVRIFGDLYERKAEVANLDAFSAHADRDELLEYFRKLRPKKIALVHGEANQRTALADAIRGEKLAEVFLPKRGDSLEL